MLLHFLGPMAGMGLAMFELSPLNWSTKVNYSRFEKTKFSAHSTSVAFVWAKSGQRLVFYSIFIFKL